MAEDDDDGGHIFGNFHNYYTFRDPKERINLFPDGAFREMIVQSQLASGISDSHDNLKPPCILDIGCNEGDLSIQIKQRMEQELGMEVALLGVDLDAELINRAQNKYTSHCPSTQFTCVNIMTPDNNNNNNTSEYQDAIQMFLQQHHRTQFDIVFCFSTTMWIHLNHNDMGLAHFLRILSSLGQSLVIEPQPWPCYRRAAQRARRRGLGELELFSQLQHRSDVLSYITDTLMSPTCGYTHKQSYGEGDWKRLVDLYSRS